MTEQQALDALIPPLGGREHGLEPAGTEGVASEKRRRGAGAGDGEKGSSIDASPRIVIRHCSCSSLVVYPAFAVGAGRDDRMAARCAPPATDHRRTIR